ncbi:MAG: ABC transporter permease [Cyclobacteriaceae bacterium]
MEEIEGDLDEYYMLYRKKYPVWLTNIYLFYHLVSFIRPYTIRRQNSKFWIMLNNYFKFALRYLVKHKMNATLTIASLSIGIACFLFIFIYLKGEISYDKHFTDYERIHRVPIDFVFDGDRIHDATTPPALAPMLKENLPEVAAATRIFPSWGGKYLIGQNEDRSFYEEGVYRVDEHFLKVFDFEVLEGRPEEFFTEPNNIVLTKSIAEKYFGSESALGKELTLFNADNLRVTVKGVIEDVPFNTHFTFDFLRPMIFSGDEDIDSNWGWFNYYTYVKLNKGASIDEVNQKLQPLYTQFQTIEGNENFMIYSQPVEDIHLKSALKWELGTNNNMSNIQIFTAIAVFILLISIINYLNLTIGSLVKRTKEVGVRKSFGANTGNLIMQFVVESVTIILISLIIGSILAQVGFRFLDDLFGREISLLEIDNLLTLLYLGLGIVTIGVLSGLYPATRFSVLTSSNKGSAKKRATILDPKNILLVAQFSISVIMIIGTVTVFQQLNFFKNADKGFSIDQVLIIENTDEITNRQALVDRLNQIPSIQSAGYTNGVVGKLNWTYQAGYPDSFLMNYAVISPEYLDAMGFDLIAGRNFTLNSEADEGQTMIVNEAAMKALKLSYEQVGQNVPVGQNGDSLIYGRVIGVIKDFHYSNFKSEIKPYAFFYRADRNFNNLAVKLGTTNLSQTLAQIEGTWYSVAPNQPLQSYFLDQTFAELHETETRLSEVMLNLTFLSIFIAFMGMFAIANMVIKSRLKEIAIRKVLGATLGQVVNLVTQNFVIMVVIANVIGLPLGYLIMNNWLEDFSYRIEIELPILLAAFLFTLAIAYLLVGFRSVKAATTDLMNRLRDE